MYCQVLPSMVCIVCIVRKPGKNQPFKFDLACERAFKELKECLVSAPILAYFNLDLPSLVETDASDGVIAGVLHQKQADRDWHPIAYYSKTMIDAELNYLIHDKEMLAGYNFLIKYKPGAINRADALTRREQDQDNQAAAKVILRTQTLLGLERLDPL